MTHHAVTGFITTVSIWTGASLGILKVVDWTLSVSQKRRIAGAAETAWLWLSDQRAGKFTSLVRSTRVQCGFALFAHFSMLCITLAFLARVFWGVRLNASLEIGHPRLYPFQVWIDAAALLVSAALVSWRIHPKIAFWIASATSLPRYFGRAAKALGLAILALFGVLLLQIPIMIPYFRSETLADARSAYEHTFGVGGIVGAHALTAFVSAPILAEEMLIQTILFLSLYWIIIVWCLMALFRVAQFVLLRVVESKDGPVLGLSGLLVGLGAIAKAILG
jgi:hypothetical protein